MPIKNRCFGTGDARYERYHDEEWGVPLEDGPDERALLERLVLEGFQSGLSWLTVLRKRDAFRDAFDDFQPDVVAAYDEADVARLMADGRIIRNERKILAAIRNARALVGLHDEGLRLADIIAEHRPEGWVRPATMAEAPSRTAASTALARRLKRLGFTFVGPVTMHALQLAIGVVDGHPADCWKAGGMVAEAS